MVREKLRIRFRKAGDLRLVSHHDLMRCFERMLRRASLPFHSTGGFNPKPRLVFALSLALGVIGLNEVAELELEEEVPPEEVLHRLAAQAPGGLEIIQVQRIDPRATAQVRRAVYRVQVLPSKTGNLAERAAELLASSNCWVDRTRPKARRFDLRPYLAGLQVSDTAVLIDLWMTPTGTARPEEVLRLLGQDDLLEAGAVLERITLELHDECVGRPSQADRTTIEELSA